MADNLTPGPHEFSADEEKQMRASNRVPLPTPDPRGPPVQIGGNSSARPRERDMKPHRIIDWGKSGVYDLDKGSD